MTESKIQKSIKLFARAKKSVAGGVSSMFRGPPFVKTPIYIDRGKGAYLYDVDGNTYLDYQLSAGAVILGHANPMVNQAVKEQLEKGTAYGMATELEFKVAERIVKASPCADCVRFVNTGSESTLAALRIARATTYREKIAKFDVGYHSWYDWALCGPGSWMTVGTPGLGECYQKVLAAPGVTENSVRDTLVLPWNNEETTTRIVERFRDELAAIIVEPINRIPPKPGFLNFVKELAEKNDILVISDEVKNGFRLALGGAQEFFGYKGDMVNYAKAIANGFPIAVVGGTEEVMKAAAEYKVFLIGTLNANPLCLSAANATLRELEKKGAYELFRVLGERLQKGVKDAIRDVGIEAVFQEYHGCSTWLGPLLFTPLENITNIKEYESINGYPPAQRNIVFTREMIKRGIFVPSNSPWFLSMAHTETDVDKTIEAVGESLKMAKEIS